MILCSLSNIITIKGGSIIIGILSIIFTIYTVIKNNKKRRNSIMPFFEFENGFGMYYKDTIPGIKLTLKNKGQRALIKKIEQIEGELINSTDIINKAINSNEIILLLIVHDFITESHINVHVKYNFKIFYMDIDRHIYYQIIDGPGINPKIFPPVKVWSLRKERLQDKDKKK